MVESIFLSQCLVRITNALLLAVVASSQGCGNEQPPNDLQAQLEQIQKDFPDLHDHEKDIIKKISAYAGKALSVERRKFSKLMAAVYSKGLRMTPAVADEKIEKFFNDLRRRIDSEEDWDKFRKLQAIFESMNAEQRARMAVYIDEKFFFSTPTKL